jgi:predicted MFS family arabinose efflux permease
MITLLRQRNFALLWSGGLISLTGDWVLIAALPFYLLASVWRDWRDGLAAVTNDSVLSVLFIAVGVVTLGDSFLSGALVPFARDVVHTDARGLGWLLTARGAGGLLGTVIIGFLAFVRPGRLLTLSLGALGVVIFAASVFRSLPGELALLAIAGTQ